MRRGDTEPVWRGLESLQRAADSYQERKRQDLRDKIEQERYGEQQKRQELRDKIEQERYGEEKKLRETELQARLKSQKLRDDLASAQAKTNASNMSKQALSRLGVSGTVPWDGQASPSMIDVTERVDDNITHKYKMPAENIERERLEKARRSRLNDQWNSTTEAAELRDLMTRMPDLTAEAMEDKRDAEDGNWFTVDWGSSHKKLPAIQKRMQELQAHQMAYNNGNVYQTTQQAEAAGLPVGTPVVIDGKLAVIQ